MNTADLAEAEIREPPRTSSTHRLALAAYTISGEILYAFTTLTFPPYVDELNAVEPPCGGGALSSETNPLVGP